MHWQTQLQGIIARGIGVLLVSTCVFSSATAEEVVTLIATDADAATALQQRPLNLLKPGMGSRVLAAGGVAEADSVAGTTLDRLASEQPVEGTPVQVDLTFELGAGRNINRVYFHPGQAPGAVTVLAADSAKSAVLGQWTALSENLEFAGGEPVEVDFAYTSARILRVSVQSPVPIQISGFGVSGEDVAGQVTFMGATTVGGDNGATAQPGAMPTEMDWATPYTGALVSHISGGDPVLAQDMIDDDVTTFFEFPSQQREHYILIDIGSPREVSKVSMILSSGAGRMEVYSLSVLPAGLQRGEGSTRRGGQVVNVAETDLAGMRPLGSQIFSENSEQALFEIEPAQARWLLFRWRTADDDTAEFLVSGRAGGAASIQPLRVYEIGVIGRTPPEYMNVAMVPRTQFLSAMVAATDSGPAIATLGGAGGLGGGNPLVPAQPPPILPVLPVLPPVSP
jgi:hypothetical protein